MKKEFNEALTELVEFATVSGNKITKEQVRLYFKDIIDDEAKYDYIYKYLMGMKIEIEGVTPPEYNEFDMDRETTDNEASENIDVKVTVETKEEKNLYDMYKKEVGAIELSKEDVEKFIAEAKNGDAKALNELTQMYLPKVIELAGEYKDSPLAASDLVAEGNLALYEANIEYKGADIREEYEAYITEKIRKSMEKAVYAELGSKRTTNHLVERINALNDASTKLAKELGREANLKELSEYLAFSEDEITELMRISINALTIDEGKQ